MITALSYQELVSVFLKYCCIFPALCILACLVRAVIGPRVSDRLVAVNMSGTQVIVLISMLCVLTGETGFIDTALIYAMLSFISVAVLANIIGEVRKQ